MNHPQQSLVEKTPEQGDAGERCSVATGSALFQRVMPKCDDLMRKVWEGTPWIIEAYTGGQDDLRWEEIRNWCEEHFGPEAWPIHGHPGNWHRGSATINGNTWLGFATEEMMKAFEVAWPNTKAEPRPGRNARFFLCQKKTAMKGEERRRFEMKDEHCEN